MNHLLILYDKTSLYQRKSGFLISKEDFELSDDAVVDLGFAYVDNPFDKNSFYSIPILEGNYDENLDDLRQKAIQESLFTRRNRFLFKTPERRDPLQISVEDGMTEGLKYSVSNFSKIEKKIPELAQRISEIEKEFLDQAASLR